MLRLLGVSHQDRVAGPDVLMALCRAAPICWRKPVFSGIAAADSRANAQSIGARVSCLDHRGHGVTAV